MTQETRIQLLRICNRRVLLAVVAIALGCTGVRAQDKVTIDAGAEIPEAVTATDPRVPTEELLLLVKPLTVTELTSEKNAWMELLRAKVHEISESEIQVKRQNAQIAVKKEVADAVSDAQKAVEDAATAAAEANASAINAAQPAEPETSGAVVDTEPEATEAVSDALKAEEAAAAAEVVVQEAVAKADAAVQEAVAAAGEQDIAIDIKAVTAPGENGLADAVEQAQQKVEETQEVKVATLETLKDLRTQRAALADRLKIVLDELEKKGGAADEARYYLKAVSGINVDVTDQEAARAAVIGWLSSEEGGLRIAWNALKFLLILFAAWLVSRFVGNIVDKILRANRGLTTLMRSFVSTMLRRLVIGVGLILALAALEVDTTPLLAMIGAAGFVVAFALQGSLSNFASGIMILYFKPFDVGDWVEVAGVSGSVASLNLVSTSICTGDNKKVIVPNNAIWGDVITNATGTHQRRVDMVFGIGYGDDMAKAQSVLERVVSAHPSVLKTPETVIRVNELADSSVNFIVRPWVKTEDYWSTYWDLTRSVKEEFDAEGISIPFPQRDHHVYHETVVRLENPSDSAESS